MQNEQEFGKELNDIFSKAPNWLTRWGVTYVFGFFIFLIILANIVKYPDIEVAGITIGKDDPPVTLFARTTGSIRFPSEIKDKSHVPEGRILAYINNTIREHELKEIRSWRDSYTKAHTNTAKVTCALKLSTSLSQLAEIEKSYVNLTDLINSYKHYQELQPYASNIKLLEKLLAKHHQYRERLLAESGTAKEVREIERQKYKIDSSLSRKELMAIRDLNEGKSNYLLKKKAFQSTVSTISLNDIEETKIEKEILAEQIRKDSFETALRTDIIGAANELSTTYSLWEEKHCIIAPFAGQISFSSYLVTNYNVKEGEEILSLIPSSDSELVGILKLPMAGASKVREGQEVNVKLHNYPYEEFGMMIGRVKSIALVPNEDHYLVSVSFPHENITSYGTALDFTYRKISAGTAEIITKNRSLFNRIFDKLRFIFQKQVG